MGAFRRIPRALLALIALVAVLATTVIGVLPAFSAPAPRSAQAGWSSLATYTDDDLATRYHVDYDLQPDGSAQVTTTITWRFPAGEVRHGIYLDVPVASGYQDRTDVTRWYPLSSVSASSLTGASGEVAVLDEESGVARLRIGSGDETVDETETWVVHYTLGSVVNAISPGDPAPSSTEQPTDDGTYSGGGVLPTAAPTSSPAPTNHAPTSHASPSAGSSPTSAPATAETAEFYWNALAPAGSTAFHGVEITVHGPRPVTRAACYYGSQGATTACPAEPGETATFTPSDEQADQGVTVLAELPRAAFTGSLEPDLRAGTPEGSASGESPDISALTPLLYVLSALLPLLAAAFMGVLVWTRGRDEQFLGLTPGLVPGSDQQVPVGHGPRQPVVVQFTPPEGVPPGMVGVIIDESADTVDVAATVVDLARRGYLTMEEQPGAGRPDWLLTRTTPSTPGAALAQYESTLLDGLFARSGGTVLLSTLTNQFAGTLGVVKGEMYRDAVDRGWFRRSPERQRSSFLGAATLIGASAPVLVAAVIALGGGGSLRLPLFVLALSGMVTGWIIGLMGSRMARRTAYGSAALAQSLGFRRYLETAEASQIKFEEAQQIFSRYLPYAIVFGVAERWAAVFAEVAQAAAAQGIVISTPHWYVGTGGYSSIGTGMGDFASSAGTALASTPGSSGRSGFSYGGGFSGGGGGGGGVSGGSW